MSEAPHHRARILVVDDDPDMLRLLSMRLGSAGYQVTAVGSAEAALAQLEIERPQLVLSDVRLPGRDGLALFAEVRARHPSLPVILLTAHGTIPDAVDATARGVFGYLTKPYEAKELLDKIAQALALSTPAGPSRRADEAWRRDIVSRSNRMDDLLAEARMVAQSDASVLLRGDSGTGKEMLAHAIHKASARAGKPFVAVNCGAIPENLIEAEFFGARKGAYTGASADREGYFQAAHGGTLFLDEIGDLPLAMQAKLLRVIQERRVRSLGAVQEDAVDVRLVSATHRDLPALVQASQFRQDLYYRLNVIGLRTPALRDRPEDLPLLAQALLERLCAEAGQPVPELSSAALAWLQARELPGNVRELENLLQRALALANGPVLRPADFGETGDTEPATLPDPLPDTPMAEEPYPFVPLNPPEARGGEALPSDLQTYLDDQERQVLLKALQECGFNRTAAAARLGLNLRQIRYRIQRLGIVVPGVPGHGDSDAAD